MSCDPRSHGISGHMRSRLLALKRAPRVVGRPTPRGARVRVDVRVTACACERARARARASARVLRACARTPLAGHRESCGFFLAEMKNIEIFITSVRCGMSTINSERLLTCTRGPFLNRITSLDKNPRQQAGAGCRWALQTNFRFEATSEASTNTP